MFKAVGDAFKFAKTQNKTLREVLRERKTMKEVKIKLCGHCKGQGKTSEDFLVDYHKREYETRYFKCKSCAGSGRVVETTEVTTRPYKE